MNPQVAAGYMFRDKNWIGKAIGVVLMTLFIIPTFGYITVIIQWVSGGKEEPTPGFDRLGEYITKGLIVVFAWLTWSIPYIIVWLIASAISGGIGEANESAGGATLLFFYCILIPLAFIYWGVFQISWIRYAASEKIVDLFSFPDNLKILSQNPGIYLQLVLYTIIGNIATFILMLPASCTICGGFIIATANIYYQGHLLGQAARQLGFVWTGPTAKYKTSDTSIAD